MSCKGTNEFVHVCIFMQENQFASFNDTTAEQGEQFNILEDGKYHPHNKMLKHVSEMKELPIGWIPTKHSILWWTLMPLANGWRVWRALTCNCSFRCPYLWPASLPSVCSIGPCPPCVCISLAVFQIFLPSSGDCWPDVLNPEVHCGEGGAGARLSQKLKPPSILPCQGMGGGGTLV